MKRLLCLAIVLGCLTTAGCCSEEKPGLESTYVGRLSADSRLPLCIYVFEYKGREYISNSRGGIVIVPTE